MPALITALLSIFGSFGSLALLLGTIFNVMVGAMVAFASYGVFSNLGKVGDIINSLNGPLVGSFDANWYRVANHYLPLTEALEFMAISLITFGVVLAIRLAWRIKSTREAKNPLIG
jgi:hypothetical protein